MEPIQLGRYELLERIGQGGFGTVYKATDPMGRTVAVKVLLPGWGDHLETLQRFMLEARSAGELFHPRIATILDLDEADGRRFLVMRYVEGVSLEEKLAEDGALPWEESLRILRDLAEGLDYAHKHGFVHRDLKPSNILLGTEGAVISDFGLVKAAETSGLSASDAILGTPAYIAPEVWNGEAVTPATDIYSLACVFYEMLTGERLFQGDSAPQVMKQHIIDGARFSQEWQSRMPKGIEEVLRKALAMKAEDRYSNAGEFTEALIRIEDREEEKEAVKREDSLDNENETKPEELIIQGEQTDEKQGIIRKGVTTTEGKPLKDEQGEERVQKREQKETGTGIKIGQTEIPRNRFIGIVGTSLLLIILCIGILIWIVATLPSSPTVASTATTLPGTATMLPSTATMLPSTATTLPSATATQSKGDTFFDDRGVQMVWIPAGSFMMGSEDGDEDEKPIHEVYLDTYAIDVYEVTNDLFAVFLNDVGNNGEVGITWLNSDTPFGQIYESGGAWFVKKGYEDYPVVEVTWYGAYAYCEWREARLPTEAEWEKAARGGLKGMLYPWGDDEPTCRKRAENGVQYGDCDQKTISVGSFEPNEFGLYDVAGNTWEWVADWYQAYPGGSDNEDYGETFRVLRGGSWNSSPMSLRVADRFWRYQIVANRYDIGFRCASSP